MKKVNYLILIVFLSLLLRLIVPFSLYAFNSDYRDSGGVPFFLKVDSFHHARSVWSGGNVFLNYFIPLFFSVCVLVVFFYVLYYVGVVPKYCFLGTMLLSVFPYFYDQTLFGYVDTPPMIFFTFVMGMWFSVNLLNSVRIEHGVVNGHNIINFLFFLTLLLYLYNIWGGGVFLILSIVLLSVVFALSKLSKTALIIGITLSATITYYFKNQFLTLISYKTMGVIEYLTPRWIPYYLIILIVLICFYFRTQKTIIINYLFSGFVITTMLSLLFQRFIVFNMFFAIPLILITHRTILYSKKIMIYSLLVICLFQTIGEYSSHRPNTDAALEQITATLTEESVVLSYWDVGHIIWYYCGCDVRFRATPTNDTMLFAKLITTNIRVGRQGLDNLALQTVNFKKDYYILITDKDWNKTKHLNYLLSDKSLLWYVMRNQSFVPGYEFVSSTNTTFSKYWLYRRVLK